jgi:hypothetical protein
LEISVVVAEMSLQTSKDEDKKEKKKKRKEEKVKERPSLHQ